MACSVILHNLCSISPHTPKCYKNQTLAITHSQFLSSKSFLNLKKQSMPSNLLFKKLQTPKSRSTPLVFAVQSNFFKRVMWFNLYHERVMWFNLHNKMCGANRTRSFLFLQTVWKVGKDGIEAGTNLVPVSVPRSVARISVTVVALTISLFVLKSFVSTAIFVLATMGLVYFIFIALNKDEGPRGGGGTTTSTPSTEDTLEEARRIMDKYK